MFNGLRSEHDVWSACIKIILGLLEDSLLNGHIPATRVDFSSNSKYNSNNNSYTDISLPESPSNYSVKRKRSFSEQIQDRKMQKLSSNLANDIARSLSVVEDVDMAPYAYNKLPNDKAENPMPALRRISLSGTLNPTHNTLDQWLETQAKLHHMSLGEYKQLFHEKQKLLLSQLELLNKPDQPFDLLRDILSKVLRLANELSGDHSLPFVEVFPEWTLYENKINKLASYIQSVEDMHFSIQSRIPQTQDLLQDIKGLHHLLDTKSTLYGDVLVQNGLAWKASGLPVDEYLLNATKDWIHRLCTGLLDALDLECKKAQNTYQNIKELVDTEIGENLMESILSGLEFIAEGSMLIGYSTEKLVDGGYAMATIYGQWISEQLENLMSDKLNLKRMDIRLMQLLDNATRILTALLSLTEIIHSSQLERVNAVDNLSAVLVEITIKASGMIQLYKEKKSTSSSRVAGNIMLNPQTSFIYMSESLLSFANKIVELAGREWIDGKRIKSLQSYLEDLENSLD